MDFPGPDPADLAQVEALNRSFLDYLAGAGGALAASLPLPLRETLTGARSVIRARMSRCPFLLFSLCQEDERRWSPLFAGTAAADLLDALERPPAAEARLVCAALAFLWCYAGYNPYAARVLSGASGDWCDRLADRTLVEIFEFASGRAGLLRLRSPDHVAFWRRLLVTGTSDEGEMRHAARIWALQSILTRPAPPATRELPAAACAMAVPANRVADRAPVSPPAARRYNTLPHAGTVDPQSRKDVPER